MLTDAECFLRTSVQNVYIATSKGVIIIYLHAYVVKLYKMFNKVIKHAPISHGEWLGLLGPMFHRV